MSALTLAVIECDECGERFVAESVAFDIEDVRQIAALQGWNTDPDQDSEYEDLCAAHAGIGGTE